jgi:hypothetical protein
VELAYAHAGRAQSSYPLTTDLAASTTVDRP